ncbi:TPA: hypothetical protein PX800_002945 [Vibrio cholerae]|nr:hypothetical protein [Vibrio cholerae]
MNRTVLAQMREMRLALLRSQYQRLSNPRAKERLAVKANRLKREVTQ